jgi:hypothetical protein
MKGSRRALMWVGATLGVLLLAIQFVPVDRSNPARQTRVPASPEARAVLQRACYDCHSNEVRWPWYGYVAPASWLVAKDVRDGREALNFSTWNLLSAAEQAEAFNESWEKVAQGEMPLWFYLPLHPSAKLSPSDRAVLQSWASSGGAASASGADAGTGATSPTDANSGSGAESPPSNSGAGAAIPIDLGTGSGAGVGVPNSSSTGDGARDGDADGRGDRDGDHDRKRDGDGDHD